MGALRDLYTMGAFKSRKKHGSESPSGSGGSDMGGMDSYKRGGKVKRTGPALLHKDEEVIPAGRAKRMRKRSKKR